MSRRIENECAYCAEIFDDQHAVVGNDWKVYCSEGCATNGELLSEHEKTQVYLQQYPLAA